MSHSVKISLAACQGCVNCIKSCPTEAIRVINGEVTILSDLCIECGECIRTCNKKALKLPDARWDELCTLPSITAIADPTFFAQFKSYWHPALLQEALRVSGMNLLVEEVEEAYDLYSYAVAQIIEASPRSDLPLVSIQCPALLRLIQLQFPELLGRVVPVENPLEIAAGLWRQKGNAGKPLVLFSPCPSKMSMVYEPLGRVTPSSYDYVTSVRHAARSIMALAPDLPGEIVQRENNRWLMTARRGGECSHIQAFANRHLVTIAASGTRNCLDLLRELELGHLKGVDFVECRLCDYGCLGGVATNEPRFMAAIRLQTLEPEWGVGERELARVRELHENGELWRVAAPIEPKPRLPLSSNREEAMTKLHRMKEIYAVLPHIDCGACGRPSCMAMAEDIVRGQGEVIDCIFKLRDEITTLANRISNLASKEPHTFKRQGDDVDDRR